VNSIAWNTVVPKDKVKVCVENGRVTLEGVVDWQFQRNSVDHCVRCLAGVKDVNNHIVVKPSANRAVVREGIEAALLRNAQLDANGIRVEVGGGRVILSGTVQSAAERDEAERAAWASPGVCDVDNLLTVTPVYSLISR
jgi:osmotically-inducible protein OsmY